MKTLNFNDADLKANREGRLSDAQNKRLDAEADQIQRESKYALWTSIGVFAVVTIMIGAVTHQDPGLSQLSGFIFAGISTIFIFTFVWIVVQYGWSTNKLAHEPIRAVEGMAKVVGPHFIPQKGTEILVYRLIIQRAWYSWLTLDFENEASLDHFESGKRYRVYYLAYKGKQVLSAEEIELEKTKR